MVPNKHNIYADNININFVIVIKIRFPIDRDLGMYYCAEVLMKEKAGDKVLEFINNTFIEDISVVRDVWETYREDWPDFHLPFLEGIKDKYKHIQV